MSGLNTRLKAMFARNYMHGEAWNANSLLEESAGMSTT